MPLLTSFVMALALSLSTEPPRESTTVVFGNRLVAELPLDEPGLHKATVVDFTTKQLTWCYDWAVLPHEPEKVIVIAGQEDILLHVPPARIVDHLLQIADDLDAHDIETVLTTIVPFHPGHPSNPAIAEANALLLERAEAKVVSVIDLAQRFGGDALHPAYVADGNYLNEFGFNQLANAVTDARQSATDLATPTPRADYPDPFNAQLLT